MTVLAKIDTKNWKGFVVGEMFDIHPTTAYKMTNAQLLDDGSNPVVVNSSYNNGIGGYTSLSVTETGNIITFSDTTTADAIFYQPNDFVGYPHVQGLYPKGNYADKWTQYRLLFFLTSFKKSAILHGFDYAYKFTREIAASMTVYLPVTDTGEPNWVYMDTYMSEVLCESEVSIENLRQSDDSKHTVDITKWQEFVIGDLFPNIVKPAVLHSREVVASADGIPYIVRTKFNNGIKCRVNIVDDVELSPGGVISFGAENATFFYQEEPFVSGRDIYYIDTRKYSPMTCLFLTSCLQPIARKYSYNFGLFPELLKKEHIILPVTSSRTPDWDYMDNYMRSIILNAETIVSELSFII